MPTPLILLEQVYVARDQLQVLHNINLRVDPGEHLAILGPNGCGKSTLLKTLTCELYPLPHPGSRVRLFGRERWDLTELRRRLGLVSADPPPSAMLHLSAYDAVLTGFFSSATLWPHLAVTPPMRRLAHEALARVGAEHLAGRTVGTLSAGEQRRTLIARALVGSEAPTLAGSNVEQPHGAAPSGRMLLLDEPSNALDLVAQQALRERLRALARTGTAVVMITHNVADIFPEIRRVVLMQHGRILHEGPREAMLTSPRISALFGVPVEVSERHGAFAARVISSEV